VLDSSISEAEIKGHEPEPLGKLSRTGLFPGAACFLTLRPPQRREESSEVLEVRPKAAPLPAACYLSPFTPGHPFPILCWGYSNYAHKGFPQGVSVSESTLPGYLFRNGFARLQQTAGGRYSRFFYPSGGCDSNLLLKQPSKMAGT